MNCEFLVGAMLLDPKAAPVLNQYAHLSGRFAVGLGSLIIALDSQKPFADAGRTQRFAPTGLKKRGLA